MDMKVLVDCTPISVGGGVQATIAVLINLRARADITWKAIARVSLRPLLLPEIASDPRILFVQKRSAFANIFLRRKLQVIERAFAPDVVFTVFGPALFRARARHLVGFAQPHLIYDADCAALVRRGIQRLTDWLMRISLRQSDHIVVETQTVRRRLAERVGIDAAKISVIPNSVNPIIMKYASGESRPDKRFAFLVPSAYYRHKNLEIVPNVAAAMRQLAPDLDFEFRFTLEPQSAAWRMLACEAQQLGVADRLVTLNVLRLDELVRAYHAASAVFLPTLREASTAVYPESFVMGRPLVTSDIDFARELCGEAALFVPPSDAAAIARRLVELARSPDLRFRLVESGRKQLLKAYPDPDQKFAMQLNLLRTLSSEAGKYA
jgi:glycosyltransferase involved in cell wall biosynthesis